jgi:hypothetical protein
VIHREPFRSWHWYSRFVAATAVAGVSGVLFAAAMMLLDELTT